MVVVRPYRGSAFNHRSTLNKWIEQACYPVIQTIQNNTALEPWIPFSVHSIINGSWVIAFFQLYFRFILCWTKFRVPAFFVVRTTWFHACLNLNRTLWLGSSLTNQIGHTLAIFFFNWIHSPMLQTKDSVTYNKKHDIRTIRCGSDDVI